MFSDSVPASQIPALVLGIWTGLLRVLMTDNIGDLKVKIVDCLCRVRRNADWTKFFFFHVSSDQKIWSYDTNLSNSKKVEMKSQIMFLKILVACYQHHHVYFRHLLPCLHLSIPWSIAWKWKYTSTKALREDDSLHFSMELRHIALKSLKWSRV